MGTVRLFGHPLRSQMLLLAITEFLILMSSIYAGAFIRFSADATVITDRIDWLLPICFVFATVMMISMFAMGLYQARLRIEMLGFGLRLFTSYFLCGVILSVLFYIFPALYIGRGALALTVIVSAVGITAIRSIFFTTAVENALKRRVLVLGSGAKANSITALRRRSDLRGLHIIGCVPVAGEDQVVSSNRTIILDKPLADFATEMEVDEIIVAVADRRNCLPLNDLLECRMRGISVIDEMTFFERESGKVRLDMLKPSWIIFSDGFQINFLRRNTKRLFDLIASLAVLMLTWPIMAATVLAILIESRWKGPILYRQYRVGQGGKPFMLLKFRSMCVNAEADGKPQWAQVNDSRVTRVGSFIRRSRIDELPQILNILRGEMSFIGPRPERPEFVSQLSERINYYCERHRIKPGLSGWAQLCYPYAATEDDAIEKLQYDLYYVKNHSLLLDLSILVQTVEVVFFGKGAR